MSIWSLPEILIIHLDRFGESNFMAFDAGDPKKMFVEYPIYGLDLNRYVMNINGDNGSKEGIYDLYGVVCDGDGEYGYGHYKTYALNVENEKWYCFNDSLVEIVKNECDIVTSGAYILFYKKKKV